MGARRSMSGEVVDFINNFSSKGENTGAIDALGDKCSYWMAMVLYERFLLSNPVVMYDRTLRHFGCRIGQQVYDITGNVTDLFDWVPWDTYKRKDKKETQKIVNERVMFA